MSEGWASYLCNVNSELASVRVDLALRAKVPDVGRGWLLSVWVYFKEPRPDGLSSSEEAAKLWSLEDALAAALEKSCSAILSGCITTCGRREFYFYGSNTDGFEYAVDQTLQRHEYRFDCDKQRDESWTQYLEVLFPSPEQRQLIENGNLLNLMREKGDKLEGAREVSHWAGFTTNNDRAAFRKAAEELGYRIEREYEQSGGEYPFWIRLARQQEMAPAAIDEAVLELLRTSKATNGEYDGWECQLMADTKPGGKPKSL